MKVDKLEVSRNIEIPGGGSREAKTVVTFRKAENVDEILQLSGGDVEKALAYFNSGRWAELRTVVSNRLAGKSPEQRNFEKMVTAFRSLNPSLTEEQASQIVLAMPNMSETLKNQTGPDVPAETDEEFFASKKETKTSAPAA